MPSFAAVIWPDACAARAAPRGRRVIETTGVELLDAPLSERGKRAQLEPANQGEETVSQAPGEGVTPFAATLRHIE
jgi:hypothetical protein